MGRRMALRDHATSGQAERWESIVFFVDLFEAGEPLTGRDSLTVMTGLDPARSLRPDVNLPAMP